MSRTRNQPASGGASSRVESLPHQHGDLRVSGTLRLRADDEHTTGDNEGAGVTRHIQWSEDVVDNEGMGKKSSKGKHVDVIEIQVQVLIVINHVVSMLHIP